LQEYRGIKEKPRNGCCVAATVTGLERKGLLLPKEICFFQSHLRFWYLLGIFLLRTLRGFIALFLGARHFLLSLLERGA
jgi:hypothetical protein